MSNDSKRPDTDRPEPSSDFSGDQMFAGEPTDPGGYAALSESAGRVSDHTDPDGFSALGERTDPEINREMFRAATEESGDTAAPGGDFDADEVTPHTVDDERAWIETRVRDEVAEYQRQFLYDFLDVIDRLDEAIASAGEDTESADALGGVRQHVQDKLGYYGVAHEPAMGKTFDSTLHEALGEKSVTEAEQDGVVIEVAREGYSHDGQPLRLAGVTVGKHEP